MNDALINELNFQSVYKSIVRFPAIKLPKFVVLTGKNGSGKSHLLSAIKSGKVASSLAPNPATDVQLFDSLTIIPTDTGVFDPFQEHSQRSQLFQVIEQHREQQLPGLQQTAISLGVPPEYCSSIKNILSLDVAKLRRLLPNPENAEGVSSALREHGKNFGRAVYSQIVHHGDENWRQSISKISQLRPEAFIADSKYSFFDTEDFLWQSVDPFKQAFGRVFAVYRDLIHANDRLEKYPSKIPEQRHLTTEEFVAKHGEPPWDFVNKILKECSLDFRVDSPPMHDNTSYEPKLQKLTSQVEMRFNDLSSGERVLMSFALCLYNSIDTRQSKIFPKLLLLDEIDAPLHPSMTSSLLKTIQNVLVKDKNVSVIMTTHSPSTVAMSPEASIYSMNPMGPRLEKISRDTAIDLLTAGLPTLSVSFDGRRQVFVESRTDARIYEALYQLFKLHIASERSLVFIEVGNTDSSGGEKNAGCAQVKRFVKELSQGGNRSALGLVDWDGERKPEGRVCILSEGLRDGIESVLFDPVLLIALIVRENFEYAKKIGLCEAEDTYPNLVFWPHERWQKKVEELEKIILQSGLEKPSATLPIKYLSGMELAVSKTYLHLDDHALEQKILQSFPLLIPASKTNGGLMSHMTNTVLRDFPTLVPCDLLDTFTLLLNIEMKAGLLT